MKGNVGEQPGKNNIGTIVQENQINFKELTESTASKIINNNNNNNMKEATQSAQVVNASDKKIVALSTDQVDPCKTQLLSDESKLNRTKSKLKDDMQKEKEHEMKLSKPVGISRVQVLNNKKNKKNSKRHNQNVIQPTIHPFSDSNDFEYYHKTDIDTCTVTPTSTNTSTATSTIEEVELPIDKNKKEILERINRDRVSIVQGDTGCGKSSRLPVMLLEDSRRRGQPCLIMVRHLYTSASFATS